MTLVMPETTDQVERTYEFTDGELALSSSERRRGLRVRQARPVKVYEAAGSRYFGGRTEESRSIEVIQQMPLSSSSDSQEGWLVKTRSIALAASRPWGPITASASK